jgi:PTS system mannose-specific IIA component
VEEAAEAVIAQGKNSISDWHVSMIADDDDDEDDDAF